MTRTRLEPAPEAKLRAMLIRWYRDGKRGTFRPDPADRPLLETARARGWVWLADYGALGMAARLTAAGQRVAERLQQGETA